MKYYETHFEEYINENNRIDLHPKLNKIYNKFPDNICDFKNLILYGPSGIGKYTQMLKCIKKYSPTELKYERKLSIIFNKQNFILKVSDIHYEIDISLLGCNSKLLMHEIYQQIIDIVLTKTDKSGIIVCKYFHEIQNELLDNFYSYMQNNILLGINLKFILITEQLSFIPDKILNCCQIIHLNRPHKSNYNSCINKKIFNNIKLENISNIKILHNYNEELMIPYKIICNKILDNILNINNLNYKKLREYIYDILIYNLDISNCIWFILYKLIENNKINNNQFNKILIKIYIFFKYYNNNYRPIYHIENILLYIVSIINNKNILI
jgi:hypothetical protein